jgi:uncharacterized protein
MIIKVADIQDEGLTITDPSEFAAPYADRSWRLEDIRLVLTREGEDVLVAGEIRASVPLVCGRCLEEFQVVVRTAVDARYVPRPPLGDVELGADDLDLDFYDHDELNLDALVETETTLALPMKPLCRPDCRGLCPVCGGNRNVTPCACEQRSPDPRLAALRDLASRLRS